MGNRPHRDEGEGEAGIPGLSLTRSHTLVCVAPSGYDGLSFQVTQSARGTATLGYGVLRLRRTNSIHARLYNLRVGARRVPTETSWIAGVRNVRPFTPPRLWSACRPA